MQATLGLTIADRMGLRRSLLLDGTLILAGGLLVALFAQIRIPLPFTPVPITGQTFAVLLVGSLAERGLDRRWLSALPLFLVGQTIIYITGVAWLSTFMGWQAAVVGGLWPFIALDLVKVALAAAALPSAWSLLGELEGG